MGRYEITLGKTPINKEPGKKAVKPKLPSPAAFINHLDPPTYPATRTIPDWEASPAWLPPMHVEEIRRLNRYAYYHDPEIVANIDALSLSCFSAVSQASEENNRLLPRLGYHRFRPLVLNAAREFFLLGDVFLIWRDDDMLILDPDRVQIRHHPHQRAHIYHLMHDTSTSFGLAPSSSFDRTGRFHQGYTVLDNVYHLSRRLLQYDLLGSSIIVRNSDDPSVYAIPDNVEIYVSQFVDSWVRSNIMMPE